jgi:hypothetical protein
MRTFPWSHVFSASSGILAMDMQCSELLLLCRSIPFLDFIFQWTNDWRFCQILGASFSHASMRIGMIEPKGFFWLNYRIARSPHLQGHSPGLSLADQLTFGFPRGQQAVARARIFESHSRFTCRSAPGLDLSPLASILAASGRSCTSLISSAFITVVAFLWRI